MSVVRWVGTSVAALLTLGGCAAGEVRSEPSRTPDPYATLPAQKAGSVEEFKVVAGTPDRPVNMRSADYPRGKGFLEGPYFAVRLAWIASGPALKEPRPFLPGTELGSRRAAKGEELVVFALDPETRTGQWHRNSRADPKATLVVGDRATPLKKVPLEATNSSIDAKVDGLVVVASVPKNAPVRLRVTDQGRTQTLDVRTGERASDAIAGYYRPYLQKLKWNGSASTGISVRGGADFVRAAFDVGLKSSYSPVPGEEPIALLAPYAPSRGWAPKGRAWLLVPAPRVDVPIVVGEPGVSLVVRDPRTFRLRLPSGAEVRGSGGPKKISTRFGTVSDPEDVVFEVPEDFRKGSYVIDLARTNALVEYRDATLPGSWSRAPRTLTVPIDLG